MWDIFLLFLLYCKENLDAAVTVWEKSSLLFSWFLIMCTVYLISISKKALLQTEWLLLVILRYEFDWCSLSIVLYNIRYAIAFLYIRRPNHKSLQQFLFVSWNLQKSHEAFGKSIFFTIIHVDYVYRPQNSVSSALAMLPAVEIRPIG